MGADRDKREEERASSTRQGESFKIRPRYLPFLSSRRQPFLHFPLLLVPARGKSPFVPARCKKGTKTSRRLRRSEDRETEALPALAHYSLVPTSRFAFYITFILLHFSRDKCLRGFASRLGKCFHNVLLCRSLLVPPHLASLRREPLVSFFARARGTEE